MKYDQAIERIRSGAMSREQLVKLRRNAERFVREGDKDAMLVLKELDHGQPSEEEYVFMGFCPGASFENRQDEEWKANGICTFTFTESEHQTERFNEILPGDLMILKKRQQFGKTMRLYGHGRATGWAVDEQGIRYLKMNWSEQSEVIEVPLMGCNSTVDVKSREIVADNMPEEFYSWLEG